MATNGDENVIHSQRVLTCKNKTIRVAVVEYRGHIGLDVRELFQGDDDKFHPTSKGARVPLACGKEVIEALQAVLEEGVKVLAKEINDKVQL